MSDDEDEDDPDERNPGRNTWRFPKGCAYMLLSLFPFQNAFGINVSYLKMNFTTQTKEKEMTLMAKRRA
jgi:hypothetical protein